MERGVSRRKIDEAYAFDGKTFNASELSALEAVGSKLVEEGKNASEISKRKSEKDMGRIMENLMSAKDAPKAEAPKADPGAKK